MLRGYAFKEAQCSHLRRLGCSPDMGAALGRHKNALLYQVVDIEQQGGGASEGIDCSTSLEEPHDPYTG